VPEARESAYALAMPGTPLSRLRVGAVFVGLLAIPSACSNDETGRHSEPDGGPMGAGGATRSEAGGTVSGGGRTQPESAGGKSESAGGKSAGAGGKSAGAGGKSAGAGGAYGSGGADAGGRASDGGAGGNVTTTGCDQPGLEWKTANKTNYTSYPDPGSVECVEYSGCQYEGLFAACDGKKTKQWVSEHDIVAAFPDFSTLSLHDLCLRKGSKTIVVTVLDTCGDDDCDGCCTENKGDADELIDIESFTNERWGVEDGPIEWADLGPTTGVGCDE
jgi:hypothetical protein